MLFFIQLSLLHFRDSDGKVADAEQQKHNAGQQVGVTVGKAQQGRVAQVVAAGQEYGGGEKSDQSGGK